MPLNMRHLRHFIAVVEEVQSWSGRGGAAKDLAITVRDDPGAGRRPGCTGGRTDPGLQCDAVDVGIPLFQEDGDGYGGEPIWHDVVAVLARVQKSY